MSTELDLDDVAQSPLAQRELAQLRRDAERYRWLRDIGDATWRPFGVRDGCSAAQADAAIDAAIAEYPSEPKR